MTRGGKGAAVVLGTAALLGMGVLAAHDYIDAASFIIQAAGFSGPARTAAEWTTDDVTESERSIPWRGGILRGRVYRPAGEAGVPVLLVPGVHAGGIDEPRMIQFARDLASMGRYVVAAELPDLKAYAITPRTTDMIEDAGIWLAIRSGLAPEGRIGMAGISFAGGLSIVAGTRPSLQHHVAFVMSFGGHGDLPRTLEYLCTGVQPDGGRRPPHDYGVAIILLGVAHRLVPHGQVAPLRSAILAFLHASHVDMWDKPQAQVEFAKAKQMADALEEPARTLMTYVNTRDVAKLGAIVLPHTRDMGDDPSLSPAKATAPIFPVYLLHGSDDNVIPAVESSLLAEALREHGVDVRQLATPLITHAEVDRSAAARAIWDLVQFWAHLLDEE
jgi:dienelactone hydrolase